MDLLRSKIESARIAEVTAACLPGRSDWNMGSPSGSTRPSIWPRALANLLAISPADVVLATTARRLGASHLARFFSVLHAGQGLLWSFPREHLQELQAHAEVVSAATARTHAACASSALDQPAVPARRDGITGVVPARRRPDPCAERRLSQRVSGCAVTGAQVARCKAVPHESDGGRTQSICLFFFFDRQK